MTALMLTLPRSIRIYYQQRTALVTLGAIGLWRYSWWMVHVIRSLIYGYVVFPKRRKKADRLWASGWRPEKLFFMMTTYNEQQATTEKVLQTLVRECESLQIPAKLYIGTGAAYDEAVIKNYFAGRECTFSLEVVLVRQPCPGKRFAIGATLRAMIRQGLKGNDPVVFMDGDTFFEPDCLRQCLPFFSDVSGAAGTHNP